MVLSVSERTFKQEVLESPVPVLVNFGAPWCGLCRLIQPLLLQFQSNFSDRIKLVAVNADENFKLANTYRLTSLPTLILIENGKVRHRIEGCDDREDLRQALAAIEANYADKFVNYAATTTWQRRSA